MLGRSEAAERGSIPDVDAAILEMISEGARNTEIAERLHYSLASVKVRVRRLMQAHGARNRAELAVKALGLQPRAARAGAAFRVIHVGPLAPLSAAIHGAQFQVSTGPFTARVTVRIDPLVAMAFGLHRIGRFGYPALAALVRRLKAEIAAGIDFDRPHHDTVIDSEDELRALLEDAQCGFWDADAGRCLAASVADPARGRTDADICSFCNLPPAEIRCENAGSIAVSGVMAPRGIQAGRAVASFVCREGESISIACITACVPGSRECWNKTIEV
jgi:DNA-binding CsgD family transcriptional regulator